MPSLADTLKRNQGILTRDSSGQLVEQSQEEIQNLAQKAGLQAPPITPLGQQAIGATPHQAKMAGTPQQKQAALTMAVQPGQSLQDTMRRQQVRAVATGAEQAQMQKSENLQNLGSLGDRVHNLIQGQMQNLANANAQLQAKEQPTGPANLQADIQALAANPTDMAVMARVQTALGKDPNTVMTAQEIQDLYKDQKESIAQSGAQAVADKLTVTDLLGSGQMGYTPDQLSGLLGVPQDQLAQMTVPQLHDQINKLIADEMSKSTQLQQQAQSNVLGAAERGLAHQAGREASATGLRSSEAEMQHLEQQIQRADTVSFAGQQMSIEQALSDSNISDTITKYMSELTTNPNGPFVTQMRETEPQLVDFITRNSNVLQDAVTQLGKGAEQFQTLQTANQQALTLIGHDLAKSFGIPVDQLQATQVDPNQYAVLAAAQGLDDNQKRMYTQNLGVLSDTTKFPGVMDQLKQLSADQIRSLDLSNPNGLGMQYAQNLSGLQDTQKSVAAHEGDPEALASDIFGDYPGGYKAMQKEFENQYTASQLGLPNQWDQLSSLDPDGDGRMQSPDYYAKQVAGQTYSLQDALSGKQAPATHLNAPEDPAGPWDKDQNALWERLSGPARDGHLTAKELDSSHLTYDDLMGLSDRAPAMDPGALEHAIAQSAVDEVKRNHDLRDERGLEEAINDLRRRQDAARGRMTTSGHRANLDDEFSGDMQWLYNKLAEIRGVAPEQIAATQKRQTEYQKQRDENRTIEANGRTVSTNKKPGGESTPEAREKAKKAGTGARK